MATDLMLYNDLAVMAEPTMATGDKEEPRKPFAQEEDDAVAADADEVPEVEDGFSVAGHISKIRKVIADETFAVIACGKLLITAKDELNDEDYASVVEQIGWERRIAQLRIAAAREFGHLPDKILAQFQPCAMYQLAPRSPVTQHRCAVVQAYDEAIAKAKAKDGTAITFTWAADRITEIKAEAEMGNETETTEVDDNLNEDEDDATESDDNLDEDADEDKDEEEVRILTLFSLLDDATEHFSESDETEKKMLAHRLEALLRKYATTPYADDLRAVLAVEDEDAAAA